jgi:hypothetical protein
MSTETTGKATAVPRVMNKTEAAYASYLEGMRVAGHIIRWDYEPEKLRLADLTYYTPDFRVVYPDGAIEFHEVKGFVRDDAMVKLKVAAETHPYRFVMIKRLKGQWEVVWTSRNAKET